MDIRTIFTLAATATLFSVQSTAKNACVTDGAGDFSLSVSNRRNFSGHRRVTAEVNIPDTTQTIWKTGDGFHLDVAQKTRAMNSGKIVQLIASFEVPEPTEPCLQRMPPPGYEVVPGLNAYRLHLEPLTWEEARLACDAEGAHLAVLNSAEEAAALQGIFANAPTSIPNTIDSDVAFVGFSDISHEGKYLTIFGETISQTGYTVWGSGQPNNLERSANEDQDCGAIDRKTGQLYDIWCSDKLAFFCKYSM